MAGCEVFAGGRWSAFSAAALRRRLLEVVLCGVSDNHRRKGEQPCGIAPPETCPAALERRSERLAELLLAEARDLRSGEETEKRRKIEAFEELQGVVQRLQDAEKGGGGRRADAASEVRRLAKDSPEARETLAMLGAIPSLVVLLDAEDSDSVISALYALLNLGIGNDTNKSAIVNAGAIHKMLALIKSEPPPAAAEAIVANFLGLSALDANKPIIGASSGAISFLVRSFQNSSPDSVQSKEDALRALFNLSISPLNVACLVDAGVVPCLLAAIGDDGAEVSERSLAVISNLVAAAPEGRRAVSRSADAFPVLIDVLNWSDSPGCQEKAAYILMVMAHKSRCGDRAAMAAAGISSALLELTLLGSPLAQKRASRVLEIFREDKGKQISEGILPVSAPIASGDGGALSADAAAEEEVEGMCEEKRAVRKLVQQSLHSNMRRIAQRANLPLDFATSDRFRELTGSSTSKSLPFW